MSEVHHDKMRTFSGFGIIKGDAADKKYYRALQWLDCEATKKLSICTMNPGIYHLLAALVFSYLQRTTEGAPQLYVKLFTAFYNH